MGVPHLDSTMWSVETDLSSSPTFCCVAICRKHMLSSTETIWVQFLSCLVKKSAFALEMLVSSSEIVFRLKIWKDASHHCTACSKVSAELSEALSSPGFESALWPCVCPISHPVSCRPSAV